MSGVEQDEGAHGVTTTPDPTAHVERRPVAVALVADAAGIARLERRLADLARLRHPRIVRPGDLVRDGDGTWWLVREPVGDRTLAAVPPGSLPLDEGLSLAREVAEILEYVHSQGVAHGNLGRSAVRVAADGRARLDDFALDLGDGDAAADPRGDIHALGLLLSELCGGTAPSDVQRLIERAVRPERTARSRSMTEIVRDLDACRADIAARRTRRRAAMAVALLGVGALAWWGVWWMLPALAWETATPAAATVETREGEPVAFAVALRSRSDAIPRVTWFTDERAVAEGTNWSLDPGFDGGDRVVTVRAVAAVGDVRLERVWRVAVHDVNRPPVIAAATPAQGDVAIGPGVDQPFTVQATDPDADDALVFTWELNGQTAVVGGDPAWTLHGGKSGDRVRVVVADRRQAVAGERSWTIAVVPITVRTAHVVPGTVRPGGKVTFEMDYVVRGGPDTPPLRVGEVIELVRDGRVLSTLPRPQENRDVGDWHTTAWVQVPKTAPAGTYLVRSRLAWNGGADEGSAAFTVR